MPSSTPGLALIAGLILTSSNHVYLCERGGHVSAYEVLHGAAMCELRFYPPNANPHTVREGQTCFMALLELLDKAERDGWRCDASRM